MKPCCSCEILQQTVLEKDEVWVGGGEGSSTEAPFTCPDPDLDCKRNQSGFDLDSDHLFNVDRDPYLDPDLNLSPV